ncbi:DUF3313 domain-containing protein [Luteimonas huabeiensis]|uniref:DUF3313 domain-containing protein n=1 Tax=Luteimonas huabeiensis TaxID=1244513 RepID=UPI000466C23D|nr:DUF3313 domain-containing protein [Luteimonas huabeiensis]
MSRIPAPAAALAAACLALAGCATTQPVRYQGVESATLMRPNAADEDGRTPFLYRAPGVDWGRYSGAIVEPVSLYDQADHQFGDMDRERRRELALHMHGRFIDVLRRRYDIPPRANADALLVRLTLTGAKANTPVLSTFTKFDLGGGPYNAVQALRGREGLMSGSVSYAVEILDASSGQLLMAYVEKQYPNAMNVRASLGALDAARTGIDKGAQALLDRLQ